MARPYCSANFLMLIIVGFCLCGVTISFFLYLTRKNQMRRWVEDGIVHKKKQILIHRSLIPDTWSPKLAEPSTWLLFWLNLANMAAAAFRLPVYASTSWRQRAVNYRIPVVLFVKQLFLSWTCRWIPDKKNSSLNHQGRLEQDKDWRYEARNEETNIGRSDFYGCQVPSSQLFDVYA
jgi:hypothetical protein